MGKRSGKKLVNCHGRTLKLLGNKFVQLDTGDDGGGGFLEFATPLKPTDVKNGMAQPRAYARIHHGRIKTRIGLSAEAFYALKKLFAMIPDMPKLMAQEKKV